MGHSTGRLHPGEENGEKMIDPEIYAAIEAELADGASVDDVVRVMAETSTPGFVRVVKSAARWLADTRA